MPKRDFPKENIKSVLTMDDETDDLFEYEIIDVNDLDDDAVSTLGSSTSDEEEEEEAEHDSDWFKEMSCVPSTDDASLVFKEHTEPIVTIGLHPTDDNIVITGGQDEKPLIWNTQTGQVLMSSNKFKDSILQVAFNYNGKYVTAVDMCGNIRVWKTPSYNEVWDRKLQDIQWVKWHPTTSALLIGEVDGSVYMFRIPSGRCDTLPGPKALADVGSFMPDGKRAVICYTDGSVRVFNLYNKSISVILEVPDLPPEMIVSLDTHPDNDLIAIGTVSSKLYLIKTQEPQASVVLQYLCIEEDERIVDELDEDTVTTSVEFVAFSRKLPYNIVVAATDKALHMFDCIKQELRGYIPIPEGITKFVWPEGQDIIYVGTKVGMIAVCNVREKKRIGSFEGHSRCIQDLVLSNDGKTLFSASDDCTVRLFKVDELLLTMQMTE